MLKAARRSFEETGRGLELFRTRFAEGLVPR